MLNFDKVVFCKEAEEFLENLDSKTRNKVYYNIRKSQHIKDEKLFKKLEDEIWEFRTLFLNKKIRLFAFRHRQGNKETIVVTTHGIIKKTTKVRKQELLKAKNIKKQYLNSLNDRS